MSGLTTAEGRSPRRFKCALALLFLISILAVGCFRVNVSIVVDESDAFYSMRITQSPVLAEFGGVEGVRELLSDQAEVLKKQPSIDMSIQEVADSDGWTGIDFRAVGPVDEIIAWVLTNGDKDSPHVAKAEDEWQFSWRIQGFSDADAGSFDELESMDLGFDVENLGFEFNVEVTLPGALVSTNSEDVSFSDGKTTARWEVSDIGATLSFQLVTDETLAANGGLGTGVILAIIFGGAGLIVALSVALIKGRRQEDEPVSGESAPQVG